MNEIYYDVVEPVDAGEGAKKARAGEMLFLLSGWPRTRPVIVLVVAKICESTEKFTALKYRDLTWH